MLLWYLLANLHAERFIFVKLNADISLWLKFFGVEFYYGSVFTLKSHEVICMKPWDHLCMLEE